MYWLAAISLIGESTCPDREAVERALREILPDPSGAATNATVLLRNRPGFVDVVLLDKSGAAETAKALPVNLDNCARSAQQVALIIALWDARLDSGVVLDLPQPMAPAPPVAVRPATKLLSTVDPGTKETPAAWETDLTVALLAARSGNSFAPAATFVFHLHPQRGMLGAVASFLVTGNQQADFAGEAGAAVHWQRAHVGAGLSLSQQVGSTKLYADLQFNGGILRVRGAGFDRDMTGTDPEFGFTGSASVVLGSGLGLAKWRPWIGCVLAARARQQDVFVQGQVAGQRLPPLELLLGGGVTFVGVL